MTKPNSIEQVQAKQRMGDELSQRDQVLADLAGAGVDGVCGTMWLAAYIPRYSHYVYTLRKEGYTIRNVDCDSGWHNHKNRQIRFVLEGRPDRRPYKAPELRQLTMEEATKNG